MNEKRINIKEQEEIFSLIGGTLAKKAECFAVGGTAMMFLGLKETTKDIDLVFKNNDDYENFRDALLSLGAKETETKIFMREKVSSILTLKNTRFDLFLENLIHFKLTPAVISRVVEIHEFENLTIKIISPEDIILFKSMADRESDRIDVANIIKSKNINWELPLKEAEEQTKNSEFFFVAFLYDFLLGVREDLKAEIPKDFLKKLKNLAEKAFLEAEKKLKDRKV